jgi:hypothetical protein
VVALDVWSGKNGVSVLGTTAHWIDKDWKMRRIALDIRQLAGPHTASNIVSSLKCTLQEYGIKNLLATIRDRGANVVSATHKLGNITEWVHNNNNNYLFIIIIIIIIGSGLFCTPTKQMCCLCS